MLAKHAVLQIKLARLNFVLPQYLQLLIVDLDESFFGIRGLTLKVPSKI